MNTSEWHIGQRNRRNPENAFFTPHVFFPTSPPPSTRYSSHRKCQGLHKDANAICDKQSYCTISMYNRCTTSGDSAHLLLCSKVRAGYANHSPHCPHLKTGWSVWQIKTSARPIPFILPLAGAQSSVILGF